MLTQEQLHQLLNQQTSSSDRVSSMFDGQQFISRDVNSLIPFLKDDTDFDGRNLWIDTKYQQTKRKKTRKIIIWNNSSLHGEKQIDSSAAIQ